MFYTRRVALSGGESVPKDAETGIPTAACRREHKKHACRQDSSEKTTAMSVHRSVNRVPGRQID